MLHLLWCRDFLSPHGTVLCPTFYAFYVPNLCLCFLETSVTQEPWFIETLICFYKYFCCFYSPEQPKDHPVPEWAQQEVILHPLTSGVLESWFPQSDQSGVSSHLMESMKWDRPTLPNTCSLKRIQSCKWGWCCALLLRLLHAVPEEQEDESSVLYHELISGLADVYQTSQSTGDKRAKKREEASSAFLKHIPELMLFMENNHLRLVAVFN